MDDQNDQDLDERAFAIIEQRASVRKPLPVSLKFQRDGFSRQDVVNAFQRAFLTIGGVQRLSLWANANPEKFYPLYARLMPSTAIQIGDNAHVQIIHALAPTALDEHPDGPDTRGSSEVADG